MDRCIGRLYRLGSVSVCVVPKNTVELSQKGCLPGPLAIALPAIDLFVIHICDK